MMLLLKLLVSRFISTALEFLAFCVRHWRIVLPVLMVGLTYWYVLSLQADRDDWQQKYTTLVAEQAKAAEKREQENLLKDQKAQLYINAVMANHQAVINQLRKEYEKLNGQKDAAVKSNADLRERLRLEVANRFDTRLPGFPGTAGKPAESGGDSHATVARSTYDTLDLACSITTADYNALWQSWNEACQVYGCKQFENNGEQPGAPM